MSVLLKVVCTDKGQHPERVLAKLDRDDDHLPGRLSNGIGAAANGRVVHDELSVTFRATWPKVGRPSGTFTFSCSTCHRRPRIREATLKQVVAAGVSVLDISTLPF